MKTQEAWLHGCKRALSFGILLTCQSLIRVLLSEPGGWQVRMSSDAAAREQMEKVAEVLVTDRCATFEDCIRWARTKFQVRGSCLLGRGPFLGTLWFGDHFVRLLYVCVRACV